MSVALAGCTNGQPAPRCPTSESCSSSGTGGSVTTRETSGPSTSPVGLPAVNRTVQYESCQGANAVADVPRDQVRPLVPPEFDLFGTTPATASVFFQVLECERITANTTVFPAAYMLYAAATVSPKNDSWASSGIHRFLLGEMVSPAPLAALARTLGLPFDQGTFLHTVTPPGSDVNVHQWNVTGQDCTFQFTFHATGQTTSPGGGPGRLWFGSRPFHRFDQQFSYQYDADAQVEPLQSSGPCAAGQAVGNVSGYIGQIVTRESQSWVFNERAFS